MTKIILSCTCLLFIAVRPGSSQETPHAIPSVTLPVELDRVLREYEHAWEQGDAATLASLFTATGFAMPADKPAVRGRRAIEDEYRRAGGALVLRAVAYAVEDSVGYIVGAYGYGDGKRDVGKFVLALQRDTTGRWLIAADIDNGNGN